MKVFIGVLCAILVASAQCQQMPTLENCLQQIGFLTADLSMLFSDRSNAMYKNNALGHLHTLNQQCSFALNALGKARSLGADPVKCKAAKDEKEAAKKLVMSVGVDLRKALTKEQSEAAGKYAQAMKNIKTHC